MRSRSAAAAVVAAGLLACAEYQAFDSVTYLRHTFAERVGPARGARLVIPFELDAKLAGYLEKRLKPSGSEERRAADIVDFVFQGLGLAYDLRPTRSAVETFSARRGNCLSFVNLFVGIARAERLNAFYVEVTDAQRWSHSRGMVVSQGHIVAGMYVGGELRTYDFLPYRSKAYRGFQPIDDIAAAAHYYNNLGAEALLDEDVERALPLLETAIAIAPDFSKAANNLGVARSRKGDLEGALADYRRGLASTPDDPALLSNLVRLYQQLGRPGEAQENLDRLEQLHVSNPFFFVYQGELALARGDLPKALAYMVDAFRRDTELPEVHVGLAKVYLAMGELDKAKHHVERALQLDATHPEARRLAQLLGRSG